MTVKAGTMMVCADCGETVERTSARQIRCPACARERARQRNREKYYKHAQERAASGEQKTLNCIDCGREIVRTSARQLRCPECARESHLRLMRERNRELAKARIKPEPVIDPVADRGKSLSQMAREARELGLTYGKYQALLMSGGLEEYIRDRQQAGHTIY